MSKYTKSVVASGHPLVSEAAAIILREGGNAFDAVVAAGFASSGVEPALNSLGGGGLLLGHSAANGQNLFFDFFVDTPGLGLQNPVEKPHFFPVTVQFSGSKQDFNVGLGSVAVPGTLKGLLHIHKRLGYMDLASVVAPAVQYAKKHILNVKQAYFLKLLRPIMTLSSKGREIYEPGGSYLQEGSFLTNPELAAFIEHVSRDGGKEFYNGEIARKIGKEMQEEDGLLTVTDLASFEVRERTPLKVPFRKYDFFTSPAPSMGGALIGLSLSLQSLCTTGQPQYAFGSGEYLIHTTGLMQEVERVREKGVFNASDLENFLRSDRSQESVKRIRMFSRGTTHISIADKQGNCASMTCSNGEGAGYFAPGTGVMLNNMMGEDDLHPDGFHSSPPGQRVGSMMSPSLLIKDNEVKLVIGSGGSKRIRTAVTQVLGQIVDFKRSLQEAVDAPRIHWDGETVQMEPGFAEDGVEKLREHASVNEWNSQGVYFGGVHAVIPGMEGAADKRRGGKVLEIV
ncbi:gamma-glutamyltransferase [Desulfocapsa sulfexigens DSM 10523]|uniref:Gamma-glutamyltransferase n=1 Tax=Desulfocapsa sulfexigens (strain DSM 10523 / SB164P1) TaxID=1167006 RepID=M1PC58_DESSD|nr:gamma-glutamyltransferase [Desulfocapsa sulfexigens]AGF79212.1 gamma-glutamyltransferase [Desulfocapsa sulfexigens DSM 10523]